MKIIAKDNFDRDNVPDILIADYNARVGRFTWDSCGTCKHYRPIEGGCAPLDTNADILKCHVNDNVVVCTKYEPSDAYKQIQQF